ncbi:hypothetical protein SLS62_002937 [Diatrype stigma]|uniref:Uncharacterized protein n=1 Tax=Diatrype stigma TaxID=117547 RepID=A0AAN9UXN7_9PEZI
MTQSRNAPLLRGAPTSPSKLSPISAHGPSLASLRAGVGAGGGASIVFANRAGASRNLSWSSLWPFGSKKPTSETLVEPAATEPAATEPAATETAFPTPKGLGSDVSPTASTASPEIASTTPVVDEPVSTLAAAEADPLGGLDFTSVLDMTEQIGYLKNLGLDYGWGPTASSEWLLEHIYIYTGLPWWGTLLAVASIWRVIMFIPTTRATQASARLQLAHANPEYKEAFEEFKAANRAKDQSNLLTARHKMKAITSRSGAKWWWIPAPFLTVPFTYGMFRLMRGMAAIPVPSLETGGTAWFTDLTVHDPYYVLPILNVALGTYMFQVTIPPLFVYSVLG